MTIQYRSHDQKDCHANFDLKHFNIFLRTIGSCKLALGMIIGGIAHEKQVQMMMLG